MSSCAIPRRRSASSTSRSALAQDFRNFDFLSPWEGAEYIIPGDEKAQPEAPGAPTPLKADEINKAAAPQGRGAAADAQDDRA